MEKQDGKNKIVVFGAFWCPDTLRSARVLKGQEIKYEAKNIENPVTAAELKRITKKEIRVPTIFFPDGTNLVEPADETLAEKIQSLRKKRPVRLIK